MARDFQEHGIAAAPLVSSLDLVNDPHLRARGFWQDTSAGTLPGLPWHTSFPSPTFPARALGADTDTLLADVLALAPEDIAALRRGGCFG
jgi:crotonobetainyl-CoA:carnitine CoA-transferase CaiB-like acyl-CoA transferase